MHGLTMCEAMELDWKRCLSEHMSELVERSRFARDHWSQSQTEEPRLVVYMSQLSLSHIVVLQWCHHGTIEGCRGIQGWRDTED